MKRWKLWLGLRKRCVTEKGVRLVYNKWLSYFQRGLKMRMVWWGGETGWKLQVIRDMNEVRRVIPGNSGCGYVVFTVRPRHYSLSTHTSTHDLQRKNRRFCWKFYRFSRYKTVLIDLWTLSDTGGKKVTHFFLSRIDS